MYTAQSDDDLMNNDNLMILTMSSSIANLIPTYFISSNRTTIEKWMMILHLPCSIGVHKFQLLLIQLLLIVSNPKVSMSIHLLIVLLDNQCMNVVHVLQIIDNFSKIKRIPHINQTFFNLSLQFISRSILISPYTDCRRQNL